MSFFDFLPGRRKSRPKAAATTVQSRQQALEEADWLVAANAATIPDSPEGFLDSIDYLRWEEPKIDSVAFQRDVDAKLQPLPDGIIKEALE